METRSYWASRRRTSLYIGQNVCNSVLPLWQECNFWPYNYCYKFKFLFSLKKLFKLVSSHVPEYLVQQKRCVSNTIVRSKEFRNSILPSYLEFSFDFLMFLSMKCWNFRRAISYFTFSTVHFSLHCIYIFEFYFFFCSTEE